MGDATLPYSWGAVRTDGDRWRFRLWAPGANSLTLRLGGSDHAMSAEGDGWYSAEIEAEPDTPYAFVLPDGTAVPDPASRRQQDTVHGPSLLTPAPASDPWAGWSGRPWEEAVIYELHIGTFTPAGTYRGAIERLDHVAEAGFTCVEIMPVAQFAGDRGWGYDGVLPYAPHPAYGTPDDLRALVRAAHDRDLMVLLDVVYNHFGPEGNHLHAYAPDFFDASRQTPWGDAIAFDRAPVRRFLIENALYWLSDFGFDGLRLDAIDQIRDPSDPELLIEMIREIRTRFPHRPVHTTTEDNRNVTHLHERQSGQVVLHTAEWNDDFHNVAHVIATGETEGYYKDYDEDRWTLLADSLAHGFAFQGQKTVAGDPRGTPSGHLPPAAFVDFLQNHDQTGNRALGERLPDLAGAQMIEALTAILLLSPHIPLMFMGEEYGERRPFCFFAGFEGDLATAVTEGRRREFESFSAFAGETDEIPDPIARATFENSRLDWTAAESDTGQSRLETVRRLLAIRREHIVPRLAGTAGHSGRVVAADAGMIAVDWQLDGAVLRLRARLADDAPDPPRAEGAIINRAGDPAGAPLAVHSILTTQ
jgi:maltooligosyltrehalose trehalohydrolase